jgi:hypothetical protein
MPNDALLHPIIYVRGFAMTGGDINEAAADPYCGLNAGSTVFRATAAASEQARKYIFDSTVSRLQSEFGYGNVFQEGLDIVDPGWSNVDFSKKSIIIYRYYDPASTLLGSGKTPSMEEFGRGLGDLIIRVRDAVCGNLANQVDPAHFRCILLAHSMGGLVCRTLLQNPDLDPKKSRQYVDKVFTYATPHNGIEMAGISVPSWLSAGDANNFNRDRMAQYLNLQRVYKGAWSGSDRVDWLPESCFPSRRFFCMVGTNRADYNVAAGISRTFAGHGSDGLVRIENASVWGVDDTSADGKLTVSAPTATAYAYRSHSGFFGIVNSEESYQNLTRFLFGDWRVDIWADIAGVTLPAGVQAEKDAGKTVSALYQFEVTAAPRGKRWLLTRRIAEEDSVACRTLQELTERSAGNSVPVYLSTIFLDSKKSLDPHNGYVYFVRFSARVPDFEVDRILWMKEHYEGGNLFSDLAIIKIRPGNPLEAHFRWQSDAMTIPDHPLNLVNATANSFDLLIPFESRAVPGITGMLRLAASTWNEP